MKTIDLANVMALPRHPNTDRIFSRLLNGEQMFIDVDIRIMPTTIGVLRPMFNWDGSIPSNGLINVRLTQGGFIGFVYVQTRVGNFSDSLTEEVCISDTDFRYDTTSVDKNTLDLLLWSSTVDDNNPLENTVLGKRGGVIELGAVFTSPMLFKNKSLTTDGIPVEFFGISTTDGQEDVAILYEPEDRVATSEYIESIRGRERYICISWSNEHRQYVTCIDGVTRKTEDCKPCITDITETGLGNSIVFVGFVPRSTLNSIVTFTTVDRLDSNYDEMLISENTANRLIGKTYGSLTPVMYGNRFCLDESRKPIRYRLDYHSSDRDTAEEITSGMTIGFEVEKEDESALKSYDAYTLLEDTGWFKERDGSLDDDSGYELVSPIYDLMSDKLDDDIKSSPQLTELINSDYGRRCGGHIHIGNGNSGATLFDKMSPWIPLIYSLYVGRIGGEYCKIKKNKDIKDDHDKYQAVRIFDNRIEIRIISAVPNVETLLWRRDLMRMIMNNLDWTPMKIMNQLLDDKSELYALLHKQYTPSQIAVKARLYAYFASELLDDAHAVKQHIMNAVDYFSKTQIRHLKSYHFNVNK
jgi:hypothetical protein